MVPYSSFYEILNVPDNASMDEIKSAFRKLALILHPDKNKNSSDAEMRFIIIYNAYSVLSDPVKRKEYDTCLGASSLLKNWKKRAQPEASNAKAALPGMTDSSYEPHGTVLSHINFLLWEIEDFLQNNNEIDWDREYSGKPLLHYVLNMLFFIDQWVLTSFGYPDYFLKARGKNHIDITDFFDNIRKHLSRGKHTWGAYVDIMDYFYNIRKRMNRFLKRTTIRDLVKAVPGFKIRFIDCILEAQNLILHYLYFLNQVLANKTEHIPTFQHSDPCFGA